VLDVIDVFRPDEATFCPYWTVPVWQSAAQETGIVVSAYRRPDEALLLVTNLGGDERSVRVPLPEELISDGPFRQAADPLDGLPAVLGKGELQLDVRGRNVRIIRLSR